MMVTTEGEQSGEHHWPTFPFLDLGEAVSLFAHPLSRVIFGWIKANDRDISLIFQRGGLEDQPNTARLHSFSDAMFFPDTIKGWVSLMEKTLMLW